MAEGRCVAWRKASDTAAWISEFAGARTTTGSVYLAECQYHRGSVEFIAKDWVRELHDLGPTRRSEHLEEMASVVEAVTRVFALDGLAVPLERRSGHHEPSGSVVRVCCDRGDVPSPAPRRRRAVA